MSTVELDGKKNVIYVVSHASSVLRETKHELIHVQRQLLLGKVDMKNASISSLLLLPTSKNVWYSFRSFLLHETCFALRGAGGHVMIAGILLSFDVGVR